MASFLARWQAYAAQLDQVALAYAHRVLDALPKPVVFVIAVIAVFGAIIFGRQMARGMNPKAPPTFEGIPLIGGILKFAKVRKPTLARSCSAASQEYVVHSLDLRFAQLLQSMCLLLLVQGSPRYCRATATILSQGPMKVMADGYASFGEVFTVPLLHYNLTFLIGPTVTSHFFKATDDEMSQTEVCASHRHEPATVANFSAVASNAAEQQLPLVFTCPTRG